VDAGQKNSQEFIPRDDLIDAPNHQEVQEGLHMNIESLYELGICSPSESLPVAFDFSDSTPLNSRMDFTLDEDSFIPIWQLSGRLLDPLEYFSSVHSMDDTEPPLA
jgi:hypothetical protein